jgi:uncharacterized membrane-anchored protein
MIKVILEGIGFICIGLVIIYITCKYPVKINVALPTISGWIGGLGSMMIGIIVDLPLILGDKKII